MSVRGGREFLAVPGPTTIPDEVLQAMQRPAVKIYSKPLSGMKCLTMAVAQEPPAHSSPNKFRPSTAILP
jgi:aspartate aminotransferase-like enzyme